MSIDGMPNKLILQYFNKSLAKLVTMCGLSLGYCLFFVLTTFVCSNNKPWREKEKNHSENWEGS